MNITIRNEEQLDFCRVEEVARNAFWNLYCPGTDLHYVVHTIRNHPDFIKELAFVIEVDGQVEGAIFYTHSKIILEDNSHVKSISFGPVCISPELHRKGLGRQLITHSMDVAKKLGYRSILTLGYPHHYIPYGFVGGKQYGISQKDGKYYKGLLALPLVDGALDGIKGYALFSQALEVNLEKAEDFDKNFPHKEKKVEKSQKEFEVACVELDE